MSHAMHCQWHHAMCDTRSEDSQPVQESRGYLQPWLPLTLLPW